MLSFKQWLTEKVAKFINTDEPALILANPTKSELSRLSTFAQKHDLTISDWIDRHPPTEWRTIYDLADKVWYVWAGFKMHSEIMDMYHLPDATSVLGRIHVRGNKLEVDLIGYGDNTRKTLALANRAIRKYMKDNGIAGKVKAG